LQTENPFEEFQRAVEKAVIEKTELTKSDISVDQAFFKESDDIGMVLSMH
jgi:hypothetical protein